jgi:hypothetical protein
MTFEYLTPEEVAEHGLSPEEAEWEEAARKREAAQEQAFQDLSGRLQRLIEHQRAMARRIKEWDLPTRPELVLIRGGKDDDA